ncbi:alpha/beta fold hydrolase [Paenibacillus piri]|uniref:Alpha/beta fold hydrolase n=1 Tax=Paenibacillus piri TaxID=2547395 RepID=A0A4R5KZD6_9BACL|nr:alpha/beta fold hydrolase [Paenibacillus piri]
MRPVIDRRWAPVRQWPYAANNTADWRWEYGYPTFPQLTWSPPPVVNGSAEKGEGTADRQQPLTFVLVHGSWADSSYWDGIAAELRKTGHTVYAPEYPGHGSDPSNEVSHAMMTRSIADFIVSKQLNDIVLVGHSFGGTLIQKTAELIPERIKRLVFLDAFVLKDGESTADELPPATREGFEKLRQSSEHDTIMLPFPLFRETFANLAGLEVVRRLYDKIRPEPAKPLFEKLDLQAFYKLDLPKSYVYLTEDNVLPQGGGYGWHPHMSGRLGLFRLIKGHSDHMTTARTEPGKIAGLLYAAGRD